MHEATIAEASAKFRQAVARGDASEALLLGRRVMYACQQEEVRLGQEAARKSWSHRVGHWVGRRVDTQEVAHYRAIKENVALALHTLGLDDAVDPAPATEDHSLLRLEALDQDTERIHRDLHHVSTLYTAISSLVRQASPLVDAVTARIDEVGPTFNRADDAILQYYVDRPQGPSYLSTLVCSVLAVTLLLIFAT